MGVLQFHVLLLHDPLQLLELEHLLQQAGDLGGPLEALGDLQLGYLEIDLPNSCRT
jgi:hypothetical protein